MVRIQTNGHSTVVPAPAEGKSSTAVLSKAEAIRQAADKGHLDTLQKMNENGVAVLAGGTEAICLAASRGYIEILQYLAEQGLTPKVGGGQAITAASASGQLEVLKWFARHGLNPQKGGEAAVYAAASRGNLEILDWLSVNGLDLKGRYAKAAIHGASTGGCMKILEWLLELGVDMKEGGGSAIRGAAKGGYLPMLKWLSCNGLNAQEGGRWAIRTSAEFGHTSVVKWLWDQGIDVSVVPGTPVRGACAGGHLDLLQWLETQGVEPSAGGVWAIRLAAEGGHTQVLDWLSKYPGMALVDHAEALTRGAANGGHLTVLQWLTSRGIDVRPHSKYVIWAAAEGGHLDILEWLSEHGGKKFAVKQGGGAAIWLAAKRGSIEILQWLLRHGVQAREGGSAAIRVAAAHGHLGALEFLADHGLSPRKGGGRAILAAAEGAHLEILEWFGNNGLNVRHHGFFSTKGAAKGGNKQVLHWLVQNECEMRDGGAATISEAAAGGHFDILEYLSRNGLPPKVGGGEAIHRAAEGGHLEVLQWMVGQGLHLEELAGDATRGASKGGQVGVLQWLLENDLDLGRHGQDAIVAAAAGGRLEILKWLVENGVVILASDGEPLRMAAAGGHGEVLEWLIDNGLELQEHGWATVCAASEAGQMDVMDWLSRNGLHEEVDRAGTIGVSKSGSRTKGFTGFKIGKKVTDEQKDPLRMRGLRWMLANTPLNDENIYDTMQRAAANGHLEILQWLSQIGRYEPSECQKWVIRLAVSGAHLEALQWLVQDGLPIKDHSSDAVRVAAECGHQEMLKWFEQIGVLNKTLGGTLIEAACMGGRLRELLHHFDLPLCRYPNSVSKILEGVHGVNSTFLANLLVVPHEVAEHVLQKVTEDTIVKNHSGQICNRAHMSRYLKAATFTYHPTFDALERTIAKQHRTFLDRILHRSDSVPVRLAKVAVRGALRPSVLRALSITPRKKAYHTLAAQSIIQCAWQKVRLLYCIDFILDIGAVAAVCHLTAMVRIDMGDGPVETLDGNRIAFDSELPASFYPLAAICIKDILKDLIKTKCFLWDHSAWYEDYFSVENGWDWFRNIATTLLLWLLWNGARVNALCQLLSAIGFSRWWKVLYSLRGFEVFGDRILPVLGAFQEVLPFLLVIFFCGGAFVHASYALAHQRTVVQVIETIYRLGVLGDFDKYEDVYGQEEVWTVGDDGVMETDDPPYLSWKSLQTFWFFATSFLFTVALMNIFIGIMSSAFDRQEERSEASFLRTRTSICLTYMLRIETLKRLFCCRSSFENDEVIWLCYQDMPMEMANESRSLRQSIRVMIQDRDRQHKGQLSTIQRSLDRLERIVATTDAYPSRRDSQVKDTNLLHRDSVSQDTNPPCRDSAAKCTRSPSDFQSQEAACPTSELQRCEAAKAVIHKETEPIEVPEELN